MNLRAFFYALFALLCLGESRSRGFVHCWQQGQGHFGGTEAGSSFYTRDHLGSIREMTSGTGAVRARYDYDPYGSREKLSGDLECAFGYTGHYHHESGLVLPPYRAYDPATARWLSRDPIAENGGINLYAYVANDPANYIDPTGELSIPPVLAGLAIYAGLNYVYDRFLRDDVERLMDRYLSCDQQRLLRNLGNLYNALNTLRNPAVLGRLGAARGGALSNADDAFNRMLQAGQAADRGGLTQAGRALEKHGSRGGVFPQATGNVAAKNAQGQQVLQEILSAQTQTISPNRFGGRDIFDAATGRGVRFDGNGKMMGFLEP